MGGNNLLADIASPLNLQRAWMTVFSNDDADGRLAASVERFASKAATELTTLASELVSGSFVPGFLRAVRIGDPGDERELHLSTVRDRVVERAVAQALTKIFDPLLSPLSFAYRRGLGTADALRALIAARDAGASWVVRSDLRSCFDRIDRDRLLKTIADYVDDHYVLLLISDLLKRSVLSEGTRHETVTGVPQGSPLSPLLCNIYLDHLDRSMAERGWELIRYADDIAIPCVDAGSTESALTDLRNVVKGLDMSLSEEKTSVMSFDEGFVFLGEEVSHRYPAAPEPAPAMKRRSVFVARDGSVIRIADGQLIVSHDDEDLLKVPQTLVGSIAVYGSTSLSSGARNFALREDVPVTFLSRRGRFEGYLSSGRRPSPRMIRAQVATTDDSEDGQRFALTLTKRIVRAKLANSRALLLRYGNRSESEAAIDGAKTCAETREVVSDAANIAIARGLEGSGAAAYWKGFASLVPTPFEFKLRRYRPAPDPVNSLLSFGYALLLGEVVGALSTAGLDPSMGYLHADQDNRPSLALDLMEEFRSLIVDTTVLSVLRHKQLTLQSFRNDETAVLLTEEGRRRFLGAFEERMLTVFAHVPSGKRVSYRRALLLQSWQLAGSIGSGQVTYEGVSWR